MMLNSWVGVLWLFNQIVSVFILIYKSINL